MAVAKAARIASLYVEPESTFATDPDSDGSDYAYVPGARDIVVSGALTELIARPLQTSTVTQVAGVPGAQGGQVSFKIDLPACTANAGAGVTVNEWITTLLESCGFDETLGTGSTISTGATTTSLPVAETSGYSVGSAVGWVNASSVMEVAFVTAMSAASGAGTLTVAPPLSGSPANSAVIYACAKYIQSDKDPGTCAIHVKRDGFQYTLLGCRGTVKIGGMSAKGVPTLDFSYQVDSYTTSSKASLPAAALPTWNPMVAKGGRVHFDTTAMPISVLDFDPGFTMSVRPSISGANGRAGWAITDRKGGGKFSYADYLSTFGTNYAAGTEMALTFQIGRSATNCFAVRVAKAQITEYPHESNGDGPVEIPVSFAIDSSQSTTVPDFAIAFL